MNKDGKTKKRGFAFVRFQSKQSAKSAAQKLNGSMWDNRPLVVDIAIGAAEYLQATSKSASAVEADEPQSKRTKTSDDIVAQALAISKDRKQFVSDDAEDHVQESSSGDEESEEEPSDVSDGIESSSELSSLDGDNSEEDDDEEKSDASSIYASSSDDGSASENDDAESSGAEDDEEEEGEDEEEMEQTPTPAATPNKSTKEQGHDVNERKTVFVRNVPFEATETELIQTFKKFGSIDFAKIVKSKVDGSSRGTAFIKFRSIFSAEKVMQEEAEVQNRLAEASGTAFGNMAQATGSRAAKIALTAPLEDLGVSLHGRRLICSSAVTPSESAQLTVKKGEDGNESSRGKRRTMLEKLKIGKIDLSDEAALSGMSKADAKRRNDAWDTIEKRTANPNITLNPLRLSVQNLPVVADGAQLREALAKALIKNAAGRKELLSFCPNEEDKAKLLAWSNGLKGELDFKRDQKHDEVIPKALRKAFASAYHAAVPKVHVVKDTERTIEKDDGSKVHRSMGFAFVEMKSESLSRAAILSLNNDPTAFADTKRPIVNFALEDARALKEQKKKEEIQAKRVERRAAAEKAANSTEGDDSGKKEAGKKRKRDTSGSEDATPKMSRGQKQREKKRLERANRPVEEITQAELHEKKEKKKFVNKRYLSKPYNPKVHGKGKSPARK
eukprot:GDKJ01014598.1.p1 GENE.GDKJ01014598.1~~GDKJ01014598.1.p1  ORF type:complete len:736 (-),score=275.23 GDKJ01014598.1:315-2330(-)